MKSLNKVNSAFCTGAEQFADVNRILRQRHQLTIFRYKNNLVLFCFLKKKKVIKITTEASV